MPDADDERDFIKLFLRLLRNDTIRETVTFQRFLSLIEIMARKLEAGEDASDEGAEMRALRPAIEMEMRALAGSEPPRN
jgi:hypothetical protein